MSDEDDCAGAESSPLQTRTASEARSAAGVTASAVAIDGPAHEPPLPEPNQSAPEAAPAEAVSAVNDSSAEDNDGLDPWGDPIEIDVSAWLSDLNISSCRECRQIIAWTVERLSLMMT